MPLSAVLSAGFVKPPPIDAPSPLLPKRLVAGMAAADSSLLFVMPNKLDGCDGFAGVDAAVGGTTNVILLEGGANATGGGIDAGFATAAGAAVTVSILNKCATDWSFIGCGGEQIPGAFACKFSRSNDNNKPCVERMWNIGITGTCFSLMMRL